jgi:hypothetical protein
MLCTVQYQRIFATDRVSHSISHLPNQDGLAIREAHCHGLSWSSTLEKAPRNELLSTFRSPGRHHYAVRPGRYSHQSIAEVRSTLSSLLTMKSKQRSANSKRITIHRVHLSLRYTNHSACTTESQVFPGVFLLCCRFAHRTSFKRLQYK